MASFSAYFLLTLFEVCTALAVGNVPFLQQGFQFDYTPTGQPVPIPTTAQCDTIPLTWSRAAFTTGPNPVAPYFIQVYTSTFLFPMVVTVGVGLSFDWPVPYIPGTQYQICMFDSKGTTGGCQRMTTVIPALGSTSGSSPTCMNLTYPAGVLDVTGNDHTGPLSQFGWVDQCTDISIKPNNGTPPFIFTVAPALRPPWNITSNDMSPVNWTVQLDWGSSFFISLADSKGHTWAFGPLHSGGGGPTDCLSDSETSAGARKRVSSSVTIASSVGGLVLGCLAGAIVAWAIASRKIGPHYDMYESDRITSFRGKSELEGHQVDSPDGDPSHYSALASSAPPESGFRNSRDHIVDTLGRANSAAPHIAFEIEPFRLSDDVTAPSTSPNVDEATGHSPFKPSFPLTNSAGMRANQQPGTTFPSSQPHRTSSSNVYVVHHDGGRAPVSVITTDGAQVIELPPSYDPSADGNPSEQQRRSVGAPSTKGSQSGNA